MIDLSFTPAISSRSTTKLHGRWLTLARILWVLTSVLAIGTFLAGLILGGGIGTPVNPDVIRQAGLNLDFVYAFRIVRVCLFALVYVIVGLVIFGYKSDDPISLVTALMLVTFGTTAFLNPSLVRISPFWQIPVLAIIALSSVLNGFVFYTFPNGRFIPRWTVGLLGLWSAWNILHLIPGLPPVLSAGLAAVDRIMITVFLLSFIVVQAYRYRRVSEVVERQQTKWVVLGVVASLSGFIIFRLLPWPFEYPELYRDLVFITAGSLFLLLIPLSFGLAIMRYRLWDIDLVINRALVYGTLTVSTMALYVLVVGYFSNIFGKGSNTIIAFIATGLVAVLFEPLRERLQRFFNRLMYGERDDPESVLARLSRQLAATLEPEATLPTIVETIAQALRLPYAAITLQEPGGEQRIAAEAGKPPVEIIRLTLTYQSSPVGQLLLAPRSRGESLSTADRRLLGVIAHQAGIAVHTVRLAGELRRLNTDLQQSRERLVAAQEEERRRLRRDLHDGVGPTLASLSQRLDTAADLVTRDPPASIALLGEIKGQVRRTLADIRRLVYALRPPVLDEFGLVSAIREHIAPYHGPNGLEITIHADEPLPPLPAAVEVAAYRIILEAFTNVVRHAQAGSCQITILLQEGNLLVEVTDDGKGLPPDFRYGVGLTAMRERAAELGGECLIETGTARGTSIRARLPIGKD